MPHSQYLRERLGSATLEPQAECIAGEFWRFTLTYTAGFFGIDDSGSIKVAYRFASDMAVPQFTDPLAANFVSIHATNGAQLEYRFDVKGNIRPWDRVIYVKVVRGFLRADDQIVLQFGGDWSSQGFQMQTFCEVFEFKVLVDAFATCDYVELAERLQISIVAGDAESYKVIGPSKVVAGAPFRFAVKAEDRWGNPTDRVNAVLRLTSSLPVEGLERSIVLNSSTPFCVMNELRCYEEGVLTVQLTNEAGQALAASNPCQIVHAASVLPFWGDIHGQSEETIGTNSVRDYFLFARDKAFIDVAAHQGNDFQITNEFWAKLQTLTQRLNQPGTFVTIPGYEWSGNTGVGGDRNVFFLQEGEQIQRSSHALVSDLADEWSDCYTSNDLFAALANRDAFVLAHVGGRYSDLSLDEPAAVVQAVEVHSAWGTFEWLLHDALRLGMRPGVMANSDGHKGRPGASYPGASKFGSYGGLTCFYCAELSREALFECVRNRCHYGTTGARIIVEVSVECGGVAGVMGDLLVGPDATADLVLHVVGTAPVERIDFFHGTDLVSTVRPYSTDDSSRRIRIQWEGAEYRGRGRETVWDGYLELEGNSLTSLTPVNFWNPDKKVTQQNSRRVEWQSITTGGCVGIDLYMDDPGRGTMQLRTPLVEAEIAIGNIGYEDTVFDAGGLGRALRVYRLPEAETSLQVSLKQRFNLNSGDNPLYVRVTQQDGHRAWSSPVYCVRQERT